MHNMTYDSILRNVLFFYPCLIRVNPWLRSHPTQKNRSPTP
ncbi:hypothetical protein Mal52_17720 [Symmachiella dynata]|uniref:Uncharacterized protein n=1 Tax=Symmachiella dynata TaxID=2527995 RepID=A0A517ZLD3_9PLAN|nr:hypothetical protein Mal52_17720 [Symmachiella dynata]